MYAYGPPVKATRLPARAKQVANMVMARAQMIKTRGAADPRFSAIGAGRTKMLAPIVVLMMFAARPGTPRARINFSSAGDCPGSSMFGPQAARGAMVLQV